VDDFFTVATRDDVAAGIGDRPLQRSATQLFWSAVAAGAGYSLLSLLLTLLRAAPERAALLARLRAMGLRPRQGVVLILFEVLPQALAATAAGAGIACLSAPLLGSAVNLSPMVGAEVPGGLRIEAAAVGWQAAALAGLCTLVVLVETALTGRRQINTELRAGDQR
jgi:putative ABC transport system permease protein